MQVKIFRANGAGEIQDLEKEINEWAATQNIEFVDTAMCQIGNATTGERYQCYVVSVWYI